MQPWIVVNHLWLYLLIAIGTLVALCMLLLALLRGLEHLWVPCIFRDFGIPLDVTQHNPVAIAYQTMNFVVFALTAYFMQYAITFGWFVLVAGLAPFLAAHAYADHRHGHEPKALPSQMQVNMVMTALILEVVLAGGSAGAAVLFRQLIVLK